MLIKSILWAAIVGVTLAYPNTEYISTRKGSPCPDVFYYENEADGEGWSGVVELENTPRDTEQINMVIVLSQPPQRKCSFNERNGEIRLKTPLDLVSNNIEKNLPLIYKVVFSRQEPLPIVTSISINGQFICIGPRSKAARGSASTLRHQLNLSPKKNGYSPSYNRKHNHDHDHNHSHDDGY